jgi:ATP-binding cassette subfamily C (CFTR/MRP) protein 1
VLVLFYLYNLFGWSAFVGVAVMTIGIPLNMVCCSTQSAHALPDVHLSSLEARMQEKQIKVADQRTRQMSELLTNIKSTKLYNWEGFFMSRILGVQNDQKLKLFRELGIVAVCRPTVYLSDHRNSH